jgi:hypothetical protein
MLLNHNLYNNIMFDHIIICSKSLNQINNILLTENKMMKQLILLNGIIFIGSCYIFIYSLYFLR